MVLMLTDGCVEDEELAEESRGKWNPCERSHRQQHRD
jgi:hypothetical protein